MKLNELKQGMVCICRNGDTLIIVNNEYYIHDYRDRTADLNDFYNDDLTAKASKKEYDIIKVMYGDKVVWERKESTFWVPENGERYYFVRHSRAVELFKYEGDKIDSEIFKNQLVFRTKEEAEKQLLKQQAMIRVIKEIARLNEGWLPNWDDIEQKYYIETFFDDGVWKLGVESATYYKALDNNLYLKSEELAEKLIATHEQDLKRMLEVE